MAAAMLSIWKGGVSAATPADTGREQARAPGLLVCTFGDSVLDCGHYNERGVTPGQLLVRNDDALFPAFRGRDLQTLRGSAKLLHRAVDGATVDGLQAQLPRRPLQGPAVALLTIGGNDLIRGLAGDNTGSRVHAFEQRLHAFLKSLPVRPVLMATVYDPTFGDDARNFLGVPAALARTNHRRVNDIISAAASRYGKLVDLHAHFLAGDPSWLTRVIEPSLIGASEIRRAFLLHI
ncbi:MAG: hypothetical protein JWP47_1701 [Polaromonas sp.]|nr:hypothetical protein [Polaromonas sp.]